MADQKIAIRLGTEGKAQVQNDFADIRKDGVAALDAIVAATEAAGTAADRAAERQAAAWKRQAAAAKAVAVDLANQQANRSFFGQDLAPATANGAGFSALAAQAEAEDRAAASAAKLRAAIDPLSVAQARYDAELAEARSLISQNAISLDEYSKRVVQLRAGLERSTDALKHDTDSTGSAANAKALLQHSIRSTIDSYAAGLPVQIIFAEQLGRLTEAAEFAGGSLGKVGAFLGGPWGIAIGAAVSIAAAFAGSLFKGSEGANAEADSANTLMKAIDDLAAAQDKANQTAEQGVQIAVGTAAKHYIEANAARAAAVAELELAKARLQANAAQQNRFNADAGEGSRAAAGGSGILAALDQGQVTALDAKIVDLSKSIDVSRESFHKAKAARAEFFAGGDADKSAAEVQRHERAVAALRVEYLKGGESEAIYRAKVADENRAHDAASASAGRHARGLSDVEKAARDAAKAEAAFWGAIKDPGQIQTELIKVNYAQEAKKARDAAKVFLADYDVDPNKDLEAIVAGIDKRKDLEISANSAIIDDLYKKQQDRIQSVAGLYKSLFTGAGGSIGAALKNALLDAVTTALAKLTVSKLGGLFDSAGGILSKLGLGLGGTGGSGITFNDYGSGAVALPHNAAGSQYFSGGMTWLAENGPELVSLPRGSRVTPAAETRRLLTGNDNSSGGHTIIVNAQDAVLTETVRGWVADGIAIASTRGAVGGASLSERKAGTRARYRLT